MLNEEYLKDSWRYLNKTASNGIDGVSAKDYEQNLEENIEGLVERLKRKNYKAKLVRRQYIPKGNGKMRPLGILTVEDKLLQTAVARILQAIYEQDFQESSFGYRPGKGAKDAVKELTYQLQYGWYGYVVEADIKGFFDNINHDWLIRMLEQRVNDRPFLGLIKKWLKAGILDTDGKILNPLTGTPQGGIVSPVLANIYLHYVLDLWFEKLVKKRFKGECSLCRYADDFVCSFQYKKEALQFYRELPKRFSKFGLRLAKDKTQVMSFSKFRMEEKTSFNFLGFEFRWGKNRKGKAQIKRRTSRCKLRKSLANFTEWCKQIRKIGLKKLLKKLNPKLRGYYNYYGVIGNYASLKEFTYQAKRILLKWINRRGQRKSYNWKGFETMLKHHNIIKPRITEKRNYQLTLAFC